MEWINCSERMPQVDDRVVIYTMYGTYALAYLGYHKDTFFDERDNIGWPVKKVTHWCKVTNPWGS